MINSRIWRILRGLTLRHSPKNPTSPCWIGFYPLAGHLQHVCHSLGLVFAWGAKRPPCAQASALFLRTLANNMRCFKNQRILCERGAKIAAIPRYPPSLGPAARTELPRYGVFVLCPGALSCARICGEFSGQCSDEESPRRCDLAAAKKNEWVNFTLGIIIAKYPSVWIVVFKLFGNNGKTLAFYDCWHLVF